MVQVNGRLFVGDSTLQYWFSWNNTDQEYDDTESIYIYQGDWYNRCVTIDPSYGILSDCGTNGLLTCSNQDEYVNCNVSLMDVINFFIQGRR